MGVLMPGWVDCRCGRDTREVPFGMGGAWVPKKAVLPARCFTFDLEVCE